MSLQPQRVRLKYGLTRYHKDLVAGVLGWTDPYADAKWGVMVNYDNGVRLDTLNKSLEDVDEDCPADEAGYRCWKTDRMARVIKAELEVGPMGGFRVLDYWVDGRQFHIFDKVKAMEILEYLVIGGVAIKTKWPGYTQPYKKPQYRTPVDEVKERIAKKVQDGSLPPEALAKIGKEEEQVPQGAAQGPAAKGSS